jgi:hypothetical protein
MFNRKLSIYNERGKADISGHSLQLAYGTNLNVAMTAWTGCRTGQTPQLTGQA